MEYFNIDHISYFEWYVIGYFISLIRFSWIVIAQKEVPSKDDDNFRTDIFRFIVLIFLCWFYPFYILLYVMNLIMKLVIFIIRTRL
jgi:hypothetical protein